MLWKVKCSCPSHKFRYLFYFCGPSPTTQNWSNDRESETEKMLYYFRSQIRIFILPTLQFNYLLFEIKIKLCEKYDDEKRSNFELISNFPGSRQGGLWWKFLGGGHRWRRHDVLKERSKIYRYVEFSIRHEQSDFPPTCWLLVKGDRHLDVRLFS